MSGDGYSRYRYDQPERFKNETERPIDGGIAESICFETAKFMRTKIEDAKRELRDELDALDAKVTQLSKDVDDLKADQRKGWFR